MSIRIGDKMERLIAFRDFRNKKHPESMCVILNGERAIKSVFGG